MGLVRGQTELRTRRERDKLSQTQVAEACATRQATVSEWETKDGKLPDANQRDVLLVLFGIELDWWKTEAQKRHLRQVSRQRR